MRRSRAVWRRAWLTGLTAVALLGLPQVSSVATTPPSGDILIIAAHPDDDIISSAGITYGASGNVTVAFLTNGSECRVATETEPETGCSPDEIGPQREAEAVAGEAVLGLSESHVIFLSYPPGLDNGLNAVRYPGAFSLPDNLLHTQTYAEHGLNNTDWHDTRTGLLGNHADFTQENLHADLVALIEAYMPDDIFTHSYWDRHPDHGITYMEVTEALKEVEDSHPGYHPYIHSFMVHVPDPSYWLLWPAADYSGGSQGQGDPTTFVNEYPLLEGDTDGQLVWDQRESFTVPSALQNPNLAVNPKSIAIEAHATQAEADNGFIRRFVHNDEVFWLFKIGNAEGRPETYSVDEGGTLTVTGSGVLINDVRGAGYPVFEGAADPEPLGVMAAALVTNVSHGSLTLNSDGSFTYSHDGSETTSDSFTYRPKQGSNIGSTTTVSITVDPVDDDPIALGDGPYNLDNGATLNVGAPGVLGNDSDPEGAGLSAQLVSDAAHGSLTLNGDGSFTYVHDGSETTSDSFTYRAKDPGGNYSSVVPVDITIEPAVVNPDDLAVAVSGPGIGASGVAVDFTATVTGGEGTRGYHWSAQRLGSEMATSTAPTFSFVPSLGGDYIVSLTVTDDTGSKSDSTAMKVLGDISGTNFTGDIIWLADQGITKGCNPPGNDLFCPDAPVTRGQMAAFLTRFLGLSKIGTGVSFADTGGSVFESDILRLATAGITKGCNPPVNDMFCPNSVVTRGQMAAFLARALGLKDVSSGVSFTDTGSSVFQQDILAMATAGITKGCNPPVNDMFCPSGVVTRGQMAAFLHRAEAILSS